MPGKRITNFEGCSYQTDAEGSDSLRTCPGEAASFTWTGDGQLASYTVGGLTWSFGYDPLGRLVRRDSAGVVKSRLLWDGDNLVAELAANGTTTVAEYSYYPGGLDNLHAVWLPTPSPAYGTWYAHPDAMGNVRALVGDTGLVGRTYDYDEWGRLQGTSTDPAGFANRDRARWKGALWLGPTLDLYYMRNRWYEPRTGRFLSEDPIGLEGGVNPFVFAGGDPVNGRDPTGLNPWSCTYYGTEFTWHHDNGDGTGWTRTWEQWDWADCYDLGWDSRSRRGPAAGNASANGPALQGDSVQQRASLPPSEPSCGSVEFPGNTGTIYVQTHQNGTVAWGIRMHDPTRDYGAWHVTVYVGIHKEDEKTQNYAPHGSVAPTHATRGAIFRIDATLVDCFGFTHRSVPNGCVIP
jgi:RHS repeat-associated protein